MKAAINGFHVLFWCYRAQPLHNMVDKVTTMDFSLLFTVPYHLFTATPPQTFLLIS